MGQKESGRSINKLKYRHNLSISQYNEFMRLQEDCCKICGRHKNNFKGILDVDHDHNTMQIRGLLCNNCNAGLGQFKENIDLLKLAAFYLNKYK